MESHGTVFLVEDDLQVREQLLPLISAAGMQCEAFSTAEEFLKRGIPERPTPSCLVLEVRLSGLSGIGLLEKLNDDGVKVPVIFLTCFGDIPTAVRAMQRGALNFFEKPLHNAALLAEISRAFDVSSRDSAAARQREAVRDRVSQLSPQEHRVLELLVEGKNNKEIATHLGIGVPTVTKHRSKVFRKLQVHDLVHLVRLATACS